MTSWKNEGTFPDGGSVWGLRVPAKCHSRITWTNSQGLMDCRAEVWLLGRKKRRKRFSCWVRTADTPWQLVTAESTTPWARKQRRVAERKAAVKALREASTTWMLDTTLNALFGLGLEVV